MANNPVVRIAFLDVGQGDTSIITIPDTREAVIVDCIDANGVIDYLKTSDVQYLRGIIATHLHLDHFSGIAAVLENIEQILGLNCEHLLYQPPRVDAKFAKKLATDEDNHSNGEDNKVAQRAREDALRSLRKWASNNLDKYNDLAVQPNVVMPLQGTIELLHPKLVDISELTLSGLNNTSGVIKVNGHACSALLMGDLQSVGWGYLKKNSTNLQSSVLKFPHHGAWKETEIADLLDFIDPAVVVISVGTQGSRYGHPNPHVLKAIANRTNTRLMCTQATARCETQIDAKRSTIIEEYKLWATKSNNYFAEERSGCPCAGTVIVELGNEAVVLQPSNEFHGNNIICHFESPQCVEIL